MADLYDIAAPKKATLEQALSDKLKTIETEKWKKENQAALSAYNEFVAENGCLGYEYREF